MWQSLSVSKSENSNCNARFAIAFGLCHNLCAHMWKTQLKIQFAIPFENSTENPSIRTDIVRIMKEEEKREKACVCVCVCVCVSHQVVCFVEFLPCLCCLSQRRWVYIVSCHLSLSPADPGQLFLDQSLLTLEPTASTHTHTHQLQGQTDTNCMTIKHH